MGLRKDVGALDGGAAMGGDGRLVQIHTPGA
jgi:hypothetical protein